MWVQLLRVLYARGASQESCYAAWQFVKARHGMYKLAHKRELPVHRAGRALGGGGLIFSPIPAAPSAPPGFIPKVEDELLRGFGTGDVCRPVVFFRI